jgi:methylmalonyl-CoA/ethylmalonyl-CoA epimerase
MVTDIHHVGIVVKNLHEAYRFWRDTLGLPLIREAEIADQGVRAALLAAGDSEIELLEPLGTESGMRRFLARHGEGLHHVCFETPDVAAELTAAKDKGAELIDATPRPGLGGQIGFLHPRSCAGVLVELAMPIELAGSRAHARPLGASSDAHGSPLRLKRLVIGAREPRGMAAVFQRLFAFAEIPMNGGPRVMLGVGRGALLIVPTGEVGGIEGMVALSMVSDDFDGLLTSLETAGTRGVLRGTGEVTLEPVATHGVHFHISRYE